MFLWVFVFWIGCTWSLHESSLEWRGSEVTPRKLVDIDEDGSLKPNEETLAWLESHSDRSLYVVSILGSYHTGKSFFLNALVNATDPQFRFSVGTTTEPTTKGIDLFGGIIELGNDGGMIILDTEGLSATDTNLNYDAKLFTVSAVLSDVLLYNSVGTIDTSSLDQLEMLSRHARLLQVRSEEPCKDSLCAAETTSEPIAESRSFPDLIWLVQSFVLDMVNGETPSEWLERVLDQQASGLRNVFSRLASLTLSYPTLDFNQMRRLSQVKMNELNPQYQQDIQSARRMLVEMLAARQQSQGRSGREIASLLRIICKAIADGKTPEIPSLWDSFVKSQLDSALQTSLDSFRQATAPIRTKLLSLDDLLALVTQAYVRTVAGFDSSTQGLAKSATIREQHLVPQLQELALNMYETGIQFVRKHIQTEGRSMVSSLRETLGKGLELPQTSKLLSKELDKRCERVMREWDQVVNRFRSGPSNAIQPEEPTSPSQPHAINRLVSVLGNDAMLPPKHDISVRFTPSPVIQEETTHLEEQIHNMKRELKDKNRRDLVKRVEELEASLLRKFEMDTQIDPVHCFSSMEFERILDSLESVMMQEHVTGMTVYADEEDYQVRVDSFNFRKDKAKEKRTKERNECIRNKCSKVGERVIRHTKDAFRDLVLPKAEPDLERIIASAGKQNRVEFTRLVGEELLRLDGVACDMGGILDKLEATAFQELKRKNIAAVALYFDGPLKQAKLEAENTPVHFVSFQLIRSQILQQARSKIEAQRRALTNNELSDELVSHALEHWLDEEIKYLIHTKQNEWLLQLAIAVTACFLVTSMFRCVRKSLFRRKPATKQKQTKYTKH